MLFTIWIRGLSAASSDVAHYITVSSPDVWYNFRQIELMVHNFPDYSWFDPMTAYPVGKSIDWGPLLPFIASGICILFGMTSRPEMMVAASWTGPLFAALMVPVLYFLGKHIWDRKAGLVSAGLITCLSGLYFYYSSFGSVDHHILETFFSTLFCLLYLFTLFYWKKNSSELKQLPTLLVGAGISILTGIVYFIGYLNMPTILLFGFIVAIYTLFQCILDNITKGSSEYLVITNLVIFLPVILLMAIFGVQQPGMSFQQYSIAQLYAIAAIIAGTVVLYILSNKTNNNSKLFLLSILGIIVAVIIASRMLFVDGALTQLTLFFGQSPELIHIAESKPWSLAQAYSSYNLAIFLALIGFIFLLYQLYLKKQQKHLFFVIWSFIVFFATVQHFRYEYYFTVNIAILSSLCIVMGITTGLSWLPDIRVFIEPLIHSHSNKTPDKHEAIASDKKTKGKKDRNNQPHTVPRKSRSLKIIGLFFLGGVTLLAILTVALSVQHDINYSTEPGRLIEKNWVETMEWLPAHTPDPGVDYLREYQKDNFVYPTTAYGILSWWDYGHYITFIGKRIPVTNPFQDNLVGPSGAAAFLLADSEQNGSKILDTSGTRYVITDTSLGTDKLASVAIWSDNETGWYPYVRSFYQTDPAQKNQMMRSNREFPPYYQTMMTRLHNFDGSMQIPGTITYLEYYYLNTGGLLYSVIANTRYLNVSSANAAILNFKPGYSGATEAVLVGDYLHPIEKVPALRHFRLVYESTGDSQGLVNNDNSGVESVNFVKVFEYVKGARIIGDGVIELKVVTNTGREFTYKQDSINGEFIVPYSTVNNPYEVKAVGNYHVIGTNRAIDVSEDDVLLGRTVGV
jgi:dolichyl-diphosphooligosaccharide--protein glycosyltransferase